jgi:hypothetical protein
MDQAKLEKLLQEKLVITGDGNVVGKDNTVNVVKQQAGDYAIQIGQVNITLPMEELRRLLRPVYTPPPLPDSETLPEPSQLPSGSRISFHRNALFTGREAQLKALAQVLFYAKTPAALVTQSIQGMGGVGKTQLAVELAYRYGRYLCGVHWINAMQPSFISDEIAACGAAMALPDWPDEQTKQVETTLYAWSQSGPRLVIFDNLEDIDTVRKWLPRLACGSIRMMITARRAEWPADLGLDVMPLGTFTPAQSQVFLRQYLREENRASDAELDQLAARLGHLPLALELAARYLRGQRRLTLPAYLEKLDNVFTHPSMRGWKAELGNPTGHDLDLAATFALSWGQVTDPTAQCMFLLVGHCAPNRPIPYGLLRQVTEEIDVEICDTALYQLNDLALLTEDSKADLIHVHPLLSEYAHKLLPKEESNIAILARVLSDLISIPEALREAEVSYEEDVDHWTSTAEFDRMFGHSSISMTEYYDNEVRASHQGYRQRENELRARESRLLAELKEVKPSFRDYIKRRRQAV